MRNQGVKNSEASSYAVAILTDDANEYRDALATHNLAGLTVLDDADLTQCQILLGEPRAIAPVLDRAINVRWVQSTWAGVSELLTVLAGLKGRTDYRLTGVKDIFAQDMVEYVFCYLLMHARDAQRYASQQQLGNWQPRSSSTSTLVGKTLGVMGLGSIGSRIAEFGHHLDMRVLGFRSSAASHPAVEQVFAPAQLHAFVAECDYVVVTLPDTPQTRGLLNADAFAAAGKDCFFINVGRASTMDETALMNALTSGIIAGAVLDVVSREPLPLDSALWHTPNLTITPHVAAPSRAQDVIPIFVDNYQRFCRDEPLRYEIDLTRGY